MRRARMLYDLQFKPQAFKDMKRIPHANASVIISKIEQIKSGLGGDVKRLKNSFPKYRLRAGVYRVLFEIESSTIIVYRILHRRMAYD